ncbi:MAG: polysaccharide pyruvyl transferase CsaB [Eubacteriales bacterium]
MEKIYKIVISGYYGFNNIGDESILRAVVDNLKIKIPQAKIVVLTKDVDGTGQKYGVDTVDRKSFIDVFSVISSCDFLISGGGSLLQDVTSKKSILYYIAIIKLALLFGKKVLIYSQGIGPINSKFNRKLTAKTLQKVSSIVVRDESSKEFLEEIGVTKNIIVTADPVLRIKPTPLDIGSKILESEGLVRTEKENITVGFAIRERNLKSDFMNELANAIRKLVTERKAKVVLIPFHFSEDRLVIDELAERLCDLSGSIFCLHKKYLTDEMLSIVGNLDMLVGVRLHSLIHATIMGVPLIGISYDPKVNSFLKSIGTKAISSIYDFSCDDFIVEFDNIMQSKKEFCDRVEKNVEHLKEMLDINEEIIKGLM